MMGIMVWMQSQYLQLEVITAITLLFAFRPHNPVSFHYCELMLPFWKQEKQASA
jgi:hypothetical protein